MSDIYEKEIVKVVCSRIIPKTFETEDVNAEICNECWEKLVGANLTEVNKKLDFFWELWYNNYIIKKEMSIKTFFPFINKKPCQATSHRVWK